MLIHAGAAWDDISRVQRLARAGWLGFENDPIAPLAYLDRLWEAVGPLLHRRGRRRRGGARCRRTRPTSSCSRSSVAYWLTLMPQQAHFDRYVLPLVPVLAVLAGSVRVAVPFALVALVAPARLERVGDARELTRTDTRLRADAWVAAQRPARRPDRGRSLDPAARRPRRRAARAARARAPVRSASATSPRLRREGVKWVIVSGAVTDRVLAAARPLSRARSRSTTQLGARPEARIRRPPGEPGLAGPWVRVYRL